MKSALLFAALLILYMALPACKGEKKPTEGLQQQPAANTGLPQQVVQQQFVPVNDSIGWDYETREDNSGTPHTKIFLNYRGVKYRAATGVGHFSELPKSEYNSPQHAVPDDALTATSGFWAGLLQTYYAAVNNNFIIIYQRTTDAEDTSGTDAVYEPVMKLDLKSTIKAR